MKARVLRGLLLAALVASVAVRFETNRAREAMASDFDIGAAVEDVIRANGYALRENPVKPPKLLSRVVYFQRPECQQASLVLPHFINEEAAQLLPRVTEPGFEIRFFYIDGNWREQSRVAMALQWIKHLVLNMFGASPYIPVKLAIVLADPPNCRPVQAIDWRPVWERDRQAHAVNTARPAAGANTGS
jgi:hypothetical protein